jgi:hypothetical protein
MRAAPSSARSGRMETTTDHTARCQRFACDYCDQGLACDCGRAQGDGSPPEVWECADGCPVTKR